MKVGDKAVIEIAEIYQSKNNVTLGRIKYTTCMMVSEGFFENQLEKFNPVFTGYTQADLDKARQEGREEAWECARNIVLTSGLKSYELEKIFNNINSEYVLRDFSANEAIQKIKSYEEQKKAEEEIKVGDEVEYKGNKMMVVSLENGCVTVIDDSAELWIVNAFEAAKKTGRHFSQLQEIFDQMKEG